MRKEAGNGMYLGVLAVISGWALRFESISLTVYAALVATGFHMFILLYEEPHLDREFGDEYREYMTRAGRWLPRLPQRRGG